MSGATVAVVGGGIAGLAAAWELVREDDIRVVVLEAGASVGGKLRSAEVAGHVVDVGAESMLARRPEGVGLAEELGLGGAGAHPHRVPPPLWGRGRRGPVPRGAV